MKRCFTNCVKDVWYVNTSVLNVCQISSLMAAAEGLVAEFSSFANSEEKKRKSNLLKSFPKIGNQMGSFGQLRLGKKKSLFHFCPPTLVVFGFTLLKEKVTPKSVFFLVITNKKFRLS